MTTNHPIAKLSPRPRICRTTEASPTLGTETPKDPTAAISSPETSTCSLTTRTARARRATQAQATIRIMKDLINNPTLEAIRMASTKAEGIKVVAATVAPSKVQGITRTQIRPITTTTIRTPISSLKSCKSNRISLGPFRTSFLNDQTMIIRSK